MSDEALFVEVSGGLLRVARPHNEWYVDVDDPAREIQKLKDGACGRVDLFTFWQRLPEKTARYPFYTEPEYIAALPISSYDAWFKNQIDGKTRNLVRKAEKKGVTIRSSVLDDAFVDGITRIFNETPVRQGRPFWHYGKSRERIREEMSDRPHLSVFLGAYADDELIGFVKLILLKHCAMMVEIISEVRHRDKATNNALVAAAVNECGARGIPYLTYSTWGAASLADFKLNNGFEKLGMPRYYVPISIRGRAALQLGLHRGIKALVPESTKEQLKALRSRWYSRFVQHQPLDPKPSSSK